MKALFIRISKSQHGEDDFGRGKSVTAKSRNRRAIKRSSKRVFDTIMSESEEAPVDTGTSSD